MYFKKQVVIVLIVNNEKFNNVIYFVFFEKLQQSDSAELKSIAGNNIKSNLLNFFEVTIQKNTSYFYFRIKVKS